MPRNSRRTDDETPPDERVASLLAHAAATPSDRPVPGEDEALAAFRASRTDTRKVSSMFRVSPARAAIAATASAGLLLTGGVAAAASGSLPGAAQDTASEWLAKVGVEVPGANDRAGDNPDERGTSADAKEDKSSKDEKEHPEQAQGPKDDKGKPDDKPEKEKPEKDNEGKRNGEDKGKGKAVSELAHETEGTGGEKGAVISEYASGGKSHAGEKGGQKDDAGKPEEPGKSTDANGKSEDAPNKGGSERADEKRSDKSEDKGKSENADKAKGSKKANGKSAKD